MIYNHEPPNYACMLLTRSRCIYLRQDAHDAGFCQSRIDCSDSFLCKVNPYSDRGIVVVSKPNFI